MEVAEALRTVTILKGTSQYKQILGSKSYWHAAAAAAAGNRAAGKQAAASKQQQGSSSKEAAARKQQQAVSSKQQQPVYAPCMNDELYVQVLKVAAIQTLKHTLNFFQAHRSKAMKLFNLLKVVVTPNLNFLQAHDLRYDFNELIRLNPSACSYKPIH